jgi:hypothetical protein
MANNLQPPSANIFAGLKLTIYSVGSANDIEAKGPFGIWYFDAGLPYGGKKALPASADVFFLTHWHTDHYSIFLNAKNAFYNFVSPPISKTSKSLIIFVSQLKAMSLPQNHCFFTNQALGAFMQNHKQVSIQRTLGNSANPNNCGLIYILDVSGLSVTYSPSGNSMKALGPFVLPGDASEDAIPNPGVPWAFLLIPHHGSPNSLALQASVFSANHTLFPALFCSTGHPNAYCSLAKGRYSSGNQCFWESTGSNGGKNIVLTFQ